MARRLVVDVITTPDYRVGYEQVDNMTFVHVDVRKWTPAIARRFREDIGNAQCLLGRSVYVLDDPDRPNLVKFLTLHGFKQCDRVLDVKGREVDLFQRTLD